MSSLPLDYDWVTGFINADLPDAARGSFDGGTESYNDDGRFVRWKGTMSPDMGVFYYPERSQIKFWGSPHKLAYGESVGAYGPSEIREHFVETMSAALHLPAGVVMTARLSRFDISANLFVDHAPSEYLRLMSPPHRMKPVGSGPSSTAFKHTRCAVIIYDKVQKMTGKRRHLIPSSWEGKNVLRLEVRFKPRYEFKRIVTLADLCDRGFYGVAVRQWQERIRSVPMVAAAWPVPFAETKGEMVEALAGVGLQATGGPAEMINRINRRQRLGLIRPRNASRQRGWVNFTLCGSQFSVELPLAQELRNAQDRAVRASLDLADS